MVFYMISGCIKSISDKIMSLESWHFCGSEMILCNVIMISYESIMLSLKDKCGLVWSIAVLGLNRFESFGFKTFGCGAAISSKYLCLIYDHYDCLKFGL